MGDLIVLKGTQNGLTMKLDQTAPLYEIHKELKEKLTASKQFFGKSNIILTLSGRNLLDEDAKKLIDIIHEFSDLTVSQLKESNQDNLAVHYIKSDKKVVDTAIKTKSNRNLKQNETQATEQAIEKKDIVNNESSDKIIIEDTTTSDSSQKNSISSPVHKNKPIHKKKDHSAQIRYGTLRSGQELYFEDSIIYIGNVHVGAKIVARGHVIIIGHLLGSVHAGYCGHYKAFVIASKMKPTQIRIGKVIARSPDKQEDINIPRMAFVEDEQICIEEIDQKLFNELSIIKS